MIKEFILAPGISVKKFSTIKSPPNPLKTRENKEAPNKIKKTIEFIFSVSKQTNLTVSILIPFFTAIIKDPNAPKDADSVGVATPKRIEPSTKTIKITGGKIVKNKLFKFTFSVESFFNGKFSGLKIEQKNIQTLYIITSSIPGIIAPANKSTLLTGVGARSPVI